MNTRRPPQMSGPYRAEVAAVVKWYNRTKGFGFVKPNDGAPDAFLHASLVAQAGHEDLADGTSLVCDITDGPRGPQVAAIHSIEPPSEPAFRTSSRPSRFGGGFGGGGGGGGFGGGAGDEVVEGKVKFYNAEKGFGFIVPDDGSKDVFVSARTLTRAGINALEAEQRVRVTTRMGQMGPMAARVELL
jgi:CspA family cold shock protein